MYIAIVTLILVFSLKNSLEQFIIIESIVWYKVNYKMAKHSSREHDQYHL